MTYLRRVILGWESLWNLADWLFYDRETTAATAAVFSAIATALAVVASALALRIARQQVLESIRPEIVLYGWTRGARGDGPAKHDVVGFDGITNYGRGSALHIRLHAHETRGNLPLAGMSTRMVPILPATNGTQLKAEIVVWFKNVERSATALKVVSITIKVSAWDTRGNRHLTHYRLLVIEEGWGLLVDEIAPGVVLERTRSVIVPAWRVGLYANLGRALHLPGKLYQQLRRKG